MPSARSPAPWIARERKTGASAGTGIELPRGMPRPISLLGLALASLLASLLAGCGTTVDFTQINDTPREPQPRPIESVKVFTSAPPRSHVDVAIISVEESHWVYYSAPETIIHKMLEQAAAIGCDGLVIGQTIERDPQQSLTQIAPAQLQKGTCIMYDEDSNVAVRRKNRAQAWR